MKSTKKQKRNVIVKCFLSPEEMQKVNSLRLELGATMSDLIRSRLLHPDMLIVNPAKLLLIFSEIGSEMASINLAMQRYFELPDEANLKDAINMEDSIKDYLIQQHKLEVQIRKLLMRIEWRE
ncbi:hypothetical protein QWY86_05705 [Pedobacter aquatilis]|uniref:hypothetical protein n=1 Tax=Pedobacter aquatilis TaxID=351343 RepID=UPI0025B40676|nr:hypothetical protein [Pedobacter aquatilis]MDN3586151.1 hypothetical protein [Pedobacter aquatilis]